MKSYIFAAILLSGFLVACEKKEHKPVEPIRPVKMVTITAGVTGTRLVYPGEVSAAQESVLSFETSGKITKLMVKEGQSVKEGDVVAQLDATNARAELQSVNARVRADKAEFERYKQLYATQAASLQDLDVKRKAYEVSRAQAVQARKGVADTKIIAPFAGKISRRLVEQHQNVQAKEGVVLLQNLGGLEVKVNIPERDWNRVRPVLTNPKFVKENTVDIEITSIPGRVFRGKISEVATSANPTTRTFGITLSFDPPKDANVLPGMTARVTADPPEGMLDTSQTISVPIESVFAANDGGKGGVWVVDKEKMTVSRVEVELGELSGGKAVVTSGLKGGESVVTSGVQKLREGMTVTEFNIQDLKN